MTNYSIFDISSHFRSALPQRRVQTTEMATLFSVCTAAVASDCLLGPASVVQQRRVCDALFGTGQATFCMRNVLQRANFDGKKQAAGKNAQKTVLNMLIKWLLKQHFYFFKMTLVRHLINCTIFVSLILPVSFK